jgi:hypothetical protein
MEGLLLLEIHSLVLSSFFRYDTALMINILTKWFNAALMVCLSIRPAKRSNVASRHGSALSLDIPLSFPSTKAACFGNVQISFQYFRWLQRTIIQIFEPFKVLFSLLSES